MYAVKSSDGYHEIYNVYLSHGRARHEAEKADKVIDGGVVIDRAGFGTWLRYALRTPVPFLLFVLVCVLIIAGRAAGL